MGLKDSTVFGDLYDMYLNMHHRRLVVVDSCCMTSPQKMVYPSTGCLLECCPFYLSLMTCNACPYHYDISKL